MKKYKVSICCDFCGKEIPGATEESHAVNLSLSESLLGSITLDVCSECSMNALRVTYKDRIEEIKSAASCAESATSTCQSKGSIRGIMSVHI